MVHIKDDWYFNRDSGSTGFVVGIAKEREDKKKHIAMLQFIGNTTTYHLTVEECLQRVMREYQAQAAEGDQELNEYIVKVIQIEREFRNLLDAVGKIQQL